MDRVYLVTGAAGHLGSVITRKLLIERKIVRILVLPGEENIPCGCEIFYGDVRDKDSLRPFFENKTGSELIVIHCAGIVSIATKVDKKVYDVNVTGTKNIVDLCIEYKVSKLVYTSSVHAIPEKKEGTVVTEVKEFSPEKVTGSYAKTKAQATAYVLEAARNGLNASVVLPSGIIGPYDSPMGHSTTLIIDYYKRRLTSGVSGGYDFVDVRDVADGIVSACERGRKGECYILSNKYIEIKEMLNILHEITGKRKITNILPLWFVRLTAPLAEAYYKILRQPPLFTAYSIYTLNTNARFSHEKAEKELGYTTRDMEETLRDTVEWLEKTERI